MPVRPILLHRPSFLFDCFVKIWATCKNFLGKWFTPPPWAKNSPYMYDREELHKMYEFHMQEGHMVLYAVSL